MCRHRSVNRQLMHHHHHQRLFMQRAHSQSVLRRRPVEYERLQRVIDNIQQYAVTERTRMNKYLYHRRTTDRNIGLHLTAKASQSSHPAFLWFWDRLRPCFGLLTYLLHEQIKTGNKAFITFSTLACTSFYRGRIGTVVLPITRLSQNTLEKRTNDRKRSTHSPTRFS